MPTVSFGVSLNTGTPLPRREDLGKFQDLVRMAEDYGAEALGTFDTSFIGGDAFVRATHDGHRVDPGPRRAPADQPDHPRAADHGLVPRLDRRDHRRARLHGHRQR